MLEKSGLPLGYSRSIQPMCENQNPRRAEYGSRSTSSTYRWWARWPLHQAKALFCSAMVPNTRYSSRRLQCAS